MKRIIFAVMFVVALSVAQTCAARDVWVAHWDSEGIDVYADDNSIRGDVAQSGTRYFKVTTKFVRGGKVQQVVNWTFSKHRDDMWRYETNTMSGGHTTVVIPRSPLFEFCMGKLGWSYRIVDMWYY
ncbi:MAG: hypothetical protein SR2Q5_01465 [Quinella sp. 2Q5]|nr:hypothetical protein [Quinella sp. 2Q5]